MTREHGKYGAGPQEARPLEWDELAPSEQELLRKIHAHLNEICEALPKAPRPTERPRTPWAQVASDPRGRLLAINGGRGSGKTTLLVTLLHQLTPTSKDADSPPPIPFARRVRSLKILDFDPLPSGLPLHAWLVQAWLPLVEHLEGCERARRRPPLEEDVLEGATLRERWDKLFERAVNGWTDVRDSRPMVDRLFDHRDQLHDYQVLAADWDEFVNEVFDRMADTDDRHVAAILVPIDDVDLQVHRNADLIHATRLLRHPRVIYIVTADLGHAREVLFLDYMRQHRQAAGLTAISANVPEEERMRHDSRILADALMEKAFPETHRFGTEPVEIDLFLTCKDSRAPGSPRDIRAVLNALRVGDVSLGNWLHERAQGSTGSNEALLQWRGVQRILDGLRPIEGNAERATHVLCRLLAQGDAKEATRIIEGRHGAVVHFGLGGTLRIQVEPGWFTGLPNQRITVGTELTWLLEGPDRRRLDAPSALLARELHEANEEPVTHRQKDGTGRRGLVQADRIITRIDTVLAWTRWSLAPRHAIFLWPFAHFPTIALLREWVKEWDTITDKIREAKDPDEKLAYAWIWCQLRWARYEALDEPDWGDPLGPDDWRKLLEQTGAAAKEDEYIGYWYQRMLPLFATPELGLPTKIQEYILHFIIADPKYVGPWLEEFDPPAARDGKRRYGERHQAVMNALYQAWDESREGSEPTDAEGEQLLEEVRRLHPHAPWYRLMSTRPKSWRRKT